ncbi:MAG: pentapeptide repeat-containing protein [Cyanobacteria bacterium P01_H01_bin.119]
MNAEELLERYAAGHRDFTGVNLNETSLIGADLPHLVLRNASLNVTNLNSTNLSHGDFAGASFNVSRLSGANLSFANLAGAKLNVANLIRAVATGANLTRVSMVRAELLRTELSNSNLSQANLSESDLKESRLRWADLSQANLSRADLRFSVLTAANLKSANLQAANLSRANLSGTNLVGAELRHANLTGANLRGANLRGANLRWVDLSGADLGDADLSDAKLSGTHLVGANLEGAELARTSLVHADLVNANLTHAHCVDGDWTGATLTGAKFYGAVCTGLLTANLNCDWIDLSPVGDRSRVQKFAHPTEMARFFNRAIPQIEIIVDASLDQSANLALATAYHQLSQSAGAPLTPPNLKFSGRNTVLTFSVRDDRDLAIALYAITLPFQAAVSLEPMLKTLLKGLYGTARPGTSAAAPSTNLDIYRLIPACQRTLALLKEHHCWNKAFFESPIQIAVTNSCRQQLDLFQSHGFGIRGVLPDAIAGQAPDTAPLPSLDSLLAFIQQSSAPEVGPEDLDLEDLDPGARTRFCDVPQ